MNLIAVSPLRTVTSVFAAIALGALLSSCGEREKIADGSEPANSTDSSPTLTILTWDEYFSEEVVKAFEKEHGIEVKFETFTNLDEMEAMLRSRPANFDLILTSSGKAADLIALELVQPIQKDLIPLFGNLDERFLGLNGDPGNEHSVPYMWGPTLIAYRSDKISEPEKSWKSLWDERYRGHVLMLDETFDTYGAALLALGYDINTQDPKHLEEATKLLLDQVERLDTRFVDIFEVRDKLLSGDCWITMTYSSDAAVLAEKEENISYFIPGEGASLWLDSFVIPRESTRADTAHLFLDYFCRPEVAAENSNELWSASANRAVRPFISKEILDDSTIYLSDEVLARCHVEGQSSPERQLTINQGFKRLFDLVREAEDTSKVGLNSPAEEDDTEK